MKKKIWVHKATSFADAERFERRYYRAMSATERVETVDWLRQVARKWKKVHGGARLRRVITIRSMALVGRRQDQADLERLRPRKVHRAAKRKRSGYR
jgi:hypothetical protein